MQKCERGPIDQWFSTTFLEDPQHCTCCMSPSPDTPMSSLWGSTIEQVTWIRCVWLRDMQHVQCWGSSRTQECGREPLQQIICWELNHFNRSYVGSWTTSTNHMLGAEPLQQIIRWELNHCNRSYVGSWTTSTDHMLGAEPLQQIICWELNHCNRSYVGSWTTSTDHMLGAEPLQQIICLELNWFTLPHINDDDYFPRN